MPEIDKSSEKDIPDQGILRDIWWGLNATIEDAFEISEQNVDITNIVYGTRFEQSAWHGEEGDINDGSEY